MSTTPIQFVLNRLRGVKKNGAGWVALCPAHEDKKPSLSIKEAADGKALLRCFAGCELDAICAALQCGKRDLFPKRNSKLTRSKGFNWQRCVDAMSENDLVRLGNQRWYSRAFCSWLHKN